jgi:hypothetical protein
MTYELIKQLELEVLYGREIELFGAAKSGEKVGGVTLGLTVITGLPLTCKLAVVSGSTVKVAVVVGAA